MAKRLKNGSLELENGRIIYANSLIQGSDLEELVPVFSRPQHFVAFAGRGGSGGNGGPGGGGGSSSSGGGGTGADGANGAQGNQGFQGTNPGAQGPQGNQGVAGTAGATGAQGAQGNQGLRGLQGFQGAQGNQGLQGFQGEVGPTAIPERTLFVSPSWDPAVDPAVYFTTISAALVQAATLTPTLSDGVAIIVYPGEYSEDIEVVSYVSISSSDYLSAAITGAVSYEPGVGVNAPSTALREVAYFENMIINGPNLTMDGTGKTSDEAVFELRDCQVGTATVITGRGTGEDLFQMFGCLHVEADLEFFDADGRLHDSFFLQINGTDSGSLVATGCTLFGVHDIAGGYLSFLTACDVVGSAGIFTGAFLAAHACTFLGGVDTTSGEADIRESEYFSSSALGGTEAVDRSVYTFTLAGSAIGANLVTIPVPYLDADYNVQLTVTNAGGGEVPAVNTKTATDFNLDDPEGGRDFDITINKV